MEKENSEITNNLEKSKSSETLVSESKGAIPKSKRTTATMTSTPCQRKRVTFDCNTSSTSKSDNARSLNNTEIKSKTLKSKSSETLVSASKGAIPKSKRTTATMTLPPNARNLRNVNFDSNISPISISENARSLNNTKKTNIKTVKERKGEYSPDYIYGTYLQMEYYKANLKHEQEKEKEIPDTKLSRLASDIAKKEVIQLNMENLNHEVVRLIESQKALNDAKFSVECDRVILGSTRLEAQLENSCIQEHIKCHLNSLKLEKVKLSQDESVEENLNAVTECLEQVTEEPQRYENETKIVQLAASNQEVNEKCKEKLKVLEPLALYKSSLEFSLSEIDNE